MMRSEHVRVLGTAHSILRHISILECAVLGTAHSSIEALTPDHDPVSTL